VGVDWDHKYCNPEAMLTRVGAAWLRRLPPCLMLGRRRDPPWDRTRTMVRALHKAGVAMEARLDGIGYHAMELFKPNCAAEFTA
jgi:acetyl esterase/lipase